MIEVKHLVKKYGSLTAVDDISFSIEKGSIYGFLGPNGAGKSTTLNILTGCLAATEGEVTVNGHDIFEEPREAKRCIGFLPELPPVYPDERVKEYLTFVAEARGVEKNRIPAEIARVLRLTHLADRQDRLIKTLSKGYRQRVGIAEALIGDPEIIILDEPMVGLDPQQIIEIRELIRGLRENHLVLVSSHILSEVQEICDRILIISRGKLIADDTTDHLEKLFAGSTQVTFTAEGGMEEMEQAMMALEDEVRVLVEETGDAEVTVFAETEGMDEKTLCRKIFSLCVENGFTLLQMTSRRANLEDVFIELTGNTKEKEAEPMEGEPSEDPEEISGNDEEIPGNDEEKDPDPLEQGKEEA